MCRSVVMRSFAAVTCMMVVQYIMPEAAHAYVDPNTGGYAFQVLFPTIAAIGAGCLFFKNQAVAFITKVARQFKKNSGGNT